MEDIMETMRMLMIVLLVCIATLIYLAVNEYSKERPMVVKEKEVVIDNCTIEGNVCIRKVFEARELQKQLDVITLQLELCEKGVGQ